MACSLQQGAVDYCRWLLFQNKLDERADPSSSLTIVVQSMEVEYLSPCVGDIVFEFGWMQNTAVENRHSLRLRFSVRRQHSTHKDNRQVKRDASKRKWSKYFAPVAKGSKQTTGKLLATGTIAIDVN